MMRNEPCSEKIEAKCFTGSGGTTSGENDRRTLAQIESHSNNITGPVYVDFKHNWSHAHSSPDLFMAHGGPITDASKSYTEGFSSWDYGAGRARNFFDIDGFITHPVLDTKRYINIADSVANNRLPEGDTKQQDIAVGALEQALVHWKHLAELGAKFNQMPVLSNTKAPFSWASLTPGVENDIQIAKAPLPHPQPARSSK